MPNPNVDPKLLEKLTPEQRRVMWEGGTEIPGTGELLHNKEHGNYTCGTCGVEIFSSTDKFDSGSGWPSFDREMAQGKVTLVPDDSHGMQRTEVRCANCGAHLGHLFDDGPTDTGDRFCINSASLGFKPKP